jgi:hypothetical protein
MSERCIDGRIYRHAPSFMDPDYEYDVGECPHVLDGKCDCPHKLPDFIPEALMKVKCEKCGLVFDDEFWSYVCNGPKGIINHKYILPREARQEAMRKAVAAIKAEG